jgi:hypothetical protein
MNVKEFRKEISEVLFRRFLEGLRKSTKNQTPPEYLFRVLSPNLFDSIIIIRDLQGT